MNKSMENVSDYTNYGKYHRNRSRKRIFIFTKNNPCGKVKRILLIGSSQTKINQIINNEIELQNVLELDLKPRAVVTSPQFQPSEKKYCNIINKLRINTNDGKVLSQSSLKNCGNPCHYHKSNLCTNYYNNGHFKVNYKLYRCQISTNQETCCCSCNSDAMFEVMKSLYDCYKKKNCDNCNCFLCGRWPREGRGQPDRQKLEVEAIEKVESKVTLKKEKTLIEKAESEVYKKIPEAKSRIGVGKALAPKEVAVSTDRLKENTPDLFKIFETTPQDQKEKIIKEAVLKGVPIPDAKTLSDKKIMDKIIKEVGLPPKPKSPSKIAKYENALNKGLITPLEGKTASQKEKILRSQVNLGLKLPEGRTSSERMLIGKIETEAKATKKIKQLERKTAKSIKESKGPSDECMCSLMTPIVDSIDQKIASTHMIKKEKELGTVSPLQDKTKSQKEKVFKGMALQGTILPEGKTASEKELLNNVRKSLGLPPAPKTPAFRHKYKEATAAGVITPLEGKTTKQKEKILREQAALGIPLPEGRTASEKSLVTKIKAVAPPLSDIPVSSKILKKAKDTGLLTPIKGKTREEREKILTGLAMHGVPLPEVRTASEKKIVDKIHANLGLPPPPVSSAAKEKYQKAYADGLIIPLEGKTASQKEKILQNQANIGLALPVGRTSSEKVIIERAKGKAKEFAPIQQLKGKPSKQKEKILKGLAMNGILLPEGKSPSEKKIIDKVRDDLGLPPEPITDSEKKAYKQAIATGDIAPLEGKSLMQKEKILRNVAKMGLKLPSGRTQSEKALVAKVLATESTMPLLKQPSVEMERKFKSSVLLTRLEGKHPEHKEKILKELAIRGIPLPEARTASEKKIIEKVQKDVAFPPPKPVIRLPEGQLVTSEISEVRLPSQVVKKAKAAGLLTPLKGKKKEQKENILKGLAMNGIPLPEAQTPSEQKVIEKVQKQLGLPQVPEEPAEKKKYNKAIISGQIAPLEGKTASQKENIIKNQLRMGLDIPVGRTPSEKAIIDKAIQSEIRIPSQVLKKAKGAGLLTPLKGKNKNEKQSILRGLAMNGIPLPEAQTTSENKIIEKVREDLGLPPVPASPTEKAKYKKALISGQIAPLEGKSLSEKEKIIKNQIQLGLKLPKGRTLSEKSLINKVVKGEVKKSDVTSPQKLNRKIDSSMVVPLEGKTKEEKVKFLKDLALLNIPLPEAQTASDKKIIQKVEADVGLPPQPKTSYEKEQYKNAFAQGFIVPLEGKTAEQKEKLLRNQAAMGLTLPKGRTSSEKDLIARIKKNATKMPKSREKFEQLEKKSVKVMKEAKGPSDQCICGIISYGALAEMPLKEVKRQPTQVRLPSQVLKKAKEAGLLTPLEGKKKEQKEKILKGLAMNNIPLPIAKSPSENKIIEKVQEDLGLPPVPQTPSDIEKYNKAIISGQIAPLEGKTPSEKEDIIKNQLKMGFNLPVGRTSSEKALIDKVKRITPLIPESKSLMVPLEGKTKEEKENILKDLALRGFPLPKAKTASDKKIIHKVQTDVGLPPPPKTSYEKDQYKKALAKGYIAPLEGKTTKQKEELLRNQAAMGLTLPKGRTASEKSLISKIKKTTPKVPKSHEQLKKLETKSAKGMKEAKKPSDECICSIISSYVPAERPEVVKIQSEVRVPSEVLKKAKDAGLLTPLNGKKKKQKQAILKGLAMNGIPLPEAKTPSEKKIIEKIRVDIGLPPEPESPAEKVKYKKAIITGKIGPLEGKTPSQKEDMIRNQLKMGLILPRGRTSSEKSLIDKVKFESEVRLPSKQLKRAKAAGLLTPLEGKSKEQKEHVLKGLAINNIPLPEAKSPSENKILKKVRADLGLPPAPELPANKEKYDKAIISGQIAPLEGKTASQKENIIRNQLKLGLTVPKGRTASEMSLINKVKKSSPNISKTSVTSTKSLTGKTKEEKENIIKDLAMRKMPLPEAKTTSDKKIIEKVQSDIGLPPQPKTPIEKIKYEKAVAKGYITPLEGKSSEQKEKILRKQAAMGIRLPKGRTSSEKALIAKINTSMLTPKEQEKIEKLEKLSAKTIKESKGFVDECICDDISPVIQKGVKKGAKAKLLEGKPKHEKEKILKDLALQGIALPEAKDKSEKKIIDKVRLDLGLPSEPTNEKEKRTYNKALTKGLLVPLEGKSKSQKEKILRDQAALGIHLPKGRTASEISLIEKVKKSTSKASKISIISENIKDLIVKQKKSISAKHGFSESIEEVTKTTTCDKGCGCDTKKVKFKHSYVKIRITSPDMSSICPCPEECFPGIKEGVFTDNDGIKITVGRVIEISGFLHKNQEKKYKKCSMVTLKTLNTFFNEEDMKSKIAKSDSYLIKNRKSECKICVSCTKSISDSNPKMDESHDEASSILNKYNSTVSSSLSSRIFEIDSSLSFVTLNYNSNKSLDVLHQCNRYLEDDVVDESVNKFRGEINLKRSSCDFLYMLSDIYKKSSTINFKSSESSLENHSQNLYALKPTRSNFIAHENYEFSLRSTNFEQNVKDNYIEDVLKEMVAKKLISQSSSFIMIVPTSSEELSNLRSHNMRSSICIQASKNCCYRNTSRNSNNGRIKKIEFKFSNDDVLLRPCSTNANKTLTKRGSALQTRTQEIKKSRVISTDTTQDRPCCCDHAISLGCSKASSWADKSTSCDKSYTNTSALMDMLKKTMSIACGADEDNSKHVRQKNKPTVKQQRTNLPCGCHSSSIELSHYEICADVVDSKRKDRDAPESCTSSTKSNVTCQCPDESAAIDCDKYLKQVQSDLTQCTSGFKLNVAPQVSLEDVLRYYAEHAQSKTDCACSKRAQKNCECPATERLEPVRGIKLHMEGKGSAAKGLNRFLCFELLDNATLYQSYNKYSNSMLVGCSSIHES